MSSPRILVVEDEGIVRKLCYRVLRPEGYDLALVASVREAHQLIQNQEWDFLISDLKFPDGSGEDLVRSFKDKFPHKKAMIISGSIEPINTLKEAEFLYKPFDGDQLVASVKKALEN